MYLNLDIISAKIKNIHLSGNSHTGSTLPLMHVQTAHTGRSIYHKWIHVNESRDTANQRVGYLEGEGSGPPSFVISLRRTLIIQSCKCDLHQENYLVDHKTKKQMHKESSTHHSRA